ncbi:MAG: recombinase RecT [Alphaproteobacteria bacterium]|nr:recombinase RecT [Alphaproteobacteria bacterium]
MASDQKPQQGQQVQQRDRAPPPPPRESAVAKAAREARQNKEAAMEMAREQRGTIQRFLKPLNVDVDFFYSALDIGMSRILATDASFFNTVKPQSFLDSVIRAARDGLLPDGKQAAIVRFKDEAQYMPMIEGFTEILYKTGLVASVNGNVVIEGDEFDWEEGSNAFIKHKPSLTNDPQKDKALAAWCIIKLTNGEEIIEVTRHADLMRIAAMSRSERGPRNSWAGEMHKKAPFRRAMKRMPKHPRLDQLLDHDNLLYDLNNSGREEPKAQVPRDKLFDQKAAVRKPAAALEPPKEEPMPLVDTQAKGEKVPVETKKAAAPKKGRAKKPDTAPKKADEKPAESEAADTFLQHSINKIRETASKGLSAFMSAQREIKADPGMIDLTEAERGQLEAVAEEIYNSFPDEADEEQQDPIKLVAVLTSGSKKTYDDPDLWKADILAKMSAAAGDKLKAFWKANIQNVEAAIGICRPQAGRVIAQAVAKGLPGAEDLVDRHGPF